MSMFKSGTYPASKGLTKTYQTLADDPVKLINQTYTFPLRFVGQDGRFYILDQYADADGVFRLHVIVQKGQYNYQQVYDADPFMLKDNTSSVASQLNFFVCRHFLGDANTSTVIPGPAA